MGEAKLFWQIYAAVLFSSFIVAFCKTFCCESNEDVDDSPQFRTVTVTSSRLDNNDGPVIAHLAPSSVPSPGVSPSAPTELSISNASDNAIEARKERIRNRLVFQKVLSLPTYKKRKQRQKKKRRKKKKSKSSKSKKSETQDDSEVIVEEKPSPKRTRTQKKKKKIVREIEMGENANENNDSAKHDDDEDGRIHRGTNDNFVSTLRSVLESIQLFVFYNHDSTGVDDEDIIESKKAMKDQLTCSICLEEYVVGDVVVRLKGDDSDDTSSDDGGGNSCKHCFHEDCILEWLESNDECPLCRVNMLTDTP